jgi:hypothetical protein
MMSGLATEHIDISMSQSGAFCNAYTFVWHYTEMQLASSGYESHKGCYVHPQAGTHSLVIWLLVQPILPFLLSFVLLSVLEPAPLSPWGAITIGT